MGKATTFILITAALSLLFYLSGLLPDVNPFLRLLLSPELMEPSEILTTQLLAIASAGAAITVLAISKNVELAAMTIYVPFLITLLWDIVHVFNKLATANRVVALILFAPSLFLMIDMSMDKWRGRD